VSDQFQQKESGNLKESAVSMKDTYKEAYFIMHHQEKNVHGKVFGGFLMRKAIELALLTVR
jgi:acyl-coenzyme A thioesterase 9